jgi:hypothetical protein
MRRFILLFLFLFTVSLSAQSLDSFSCEDNLSYQAQITIIPPILDETVDEIVVTAMSVNDFDPVIGITAADGFTFCNVAHPEAEIYEAQLPDAHILSSPLNAQEYLVDEGQNIIQIGEFNAKQGAVVVVMESFILDSDHHYTLQLTPEMLATGRDLKAYLFALTGDYRPSLAITAPDNSTSAAGGINAQLTTALDRSTAALMATLPALGGDIQVTVGAGGAGFYALVLALQTGESLPGDAAAQVAFGEDGTVTLVCDNQIISENAVQLSLPDDTDYSVTAIASDELDPVLAIVDEAGNGRCFDNTARADSYAVELPSVQLQHSFVSAQASVSSGSIVVIGANESVAGDYVLLIEGGSMQSGQAGDIFEVQVTAPMARAFEFLHAYVFAADDEIDPILTWETSEGETIICDNAGIIEDCPESSSPLQGMRLMLANDDTLIGIDSNAMLQVAIDAGMEGTNLAFRVTAYEDTGGDYILVLHIVTD